MVITLPGSEAGLLFRAVATSDIYEYFVIFCTESQHSTKLLKGECLHPCCLSLEEGSESP